MRDLAAEKLVISEKAVLIPFYFLLGFDCLPYIAKQVHLNELNYTAIFIIGIMTWFAYLTEPSTVFAFFFPKSSVRTIVEFVFPFSLLCLVTALLAAYSNIDTSKENLNFDCLVRTLTLGPLTEEIVCRAFFFESLKNVLPNFALLLLNVVYFQCFHSAHHIQFSLVIFSLLVGLCYLRFRSLVCCTVLHILWNWFTIC